MKTLVASVGVPLLVGLIAWFARVTLNRLGFWREARTRPGGMSLTFDRAEGDPGHVLFFQHYRALPVRVSGWGVISASRAPRGHKPKLLPLDAVPWLALHTSGTWLYESVRVEPLEKPVRMLVGKDVVHAPDDPTPDSHEQFELSKLLREPLVAWVRVDAVGVLFSAASSGPWARSDYAGYPCARCGHDRAHHEPTFRPRRRRIIGWYGRCSDDEHPECRCRKFKRSRQEQLHPGEDRRAASGKIRDTP